MKNVNIFDISIKYPSEWELHFQQPPTEEIGSLELLIKNNHKINGVVCIVWRTYDDNMIKSLYENQKQKSKSIFKLGNSLDNVVENQQDKNFSNEELLRLYCDKIYKNIEKEQGTVTLTKREEKQVNHHPAEYSEFTFPVYKRKEERGNTYRMQLIVKCDISNRFIAMYTSLKEKESSRYIEQINGVFESLICHESE